MKTHGPRAYPTGSAQPAAADTRHEWYFDKAGRYQHDGFLDAPDQTPTGSVRKVAEWGAGRIAHALLVSTEWREGAKP